MVLMKEYDLNVFYEDLGEDELGFNQWADVYTIQPSVYKLDEFDQSTRQYLEAFKLTLAETRAIEPDFPAEEYGEDFFVSLDYFLTKTKTLPDSVRAVLDSLPPVDSVPFGVPEYPWINTLF